VHARRILALAAILFCAYGVDAQSERHWLVGWWQGDLQIPGMANPGRVLVVTSVQSDGTARGNMGFVGQPLAPAEIRVDGAKVRTVNAIKSVGEFTREGNDQLAGPVKGKDASVGARLNLARVKSVEDHLLVGEWWGTWHRKSIGDSGQYYLTIVGVNGSVVVGEYRSGARAITTEGGFVGAFSENTLAFGQTRFSVRDNEMTGTGGGSDISLAKKK